MDAIGVPERPDDEAEDKGDCYDNEYGWDEDEGEHRIFSIRAYGLEGALAHRDCEASGEPRWI